MEATLRGMGCMMLGLVLMASHALEWYALDGNRTAQFARGAGSTLLMLGLLGAAGSAAWERTRSIKLGVIAGLWCGWLATIILLGFALTLNLAFEMHSVAWLHEGFAASGMRDPGAFVVTKRAGRPPFVMAGIFAAGLSVCCAHPIWSSLYRGRREAVKRT